MKKSKASTTRSVFVLLVAFSLTPCCPASANDGRYIGDVITNWENDGRTMRLVQRFEYLDARGRSWPVPSGTVVDGASIPQVFWSFIGGPFEGKYRNASVIHDFYCDTRRRRWEEVHRMFYEAMLTSGVDGKKAYVMYKAVERFGPRWTEPKLDPRCVDANGRLDLDKCTENNSVIIGEITMPKVTAVELNKLLDELTPTVGAAAVQQLRDAATKLD